MFWWVGSASATEPPVVVPEIEVRPRTELSSGPAFEGTRDPAFVSQRARAGLSFDAGLVGARVILQDVREWGAEESTTDFSAEGLDMHVGTLSIGTDALELIAGRQEIVYEEQRIVGNLDWQQQARSFDAARVKWADGELSGDFVGGMLREGDVFEEPWDGNIVMGRASWLREADQVDVLAVWDHQGASELDRLTAGLWARAGSGPLSWRVEGYVQAGRADGAELRAGMLGARATLSPEASYKPGITLWYDFLSGDAAPDVGRITFFSAPYATNHKFYGLMDIAYFLQGGPSDGTGLHDASLKLQAGPSEASEVHLDLHHFAMAEPYEELAFEADFWTVWNATSALSLQGGGSVWLQYGDVDDPTLWAWLQVEVRLPH